jgi:hypothetical protein
MPFFLYARLASFKVIGGFAGRGIVTKKQEDCEMDHRTTTRIRTGVSVDAIQDAVNLEI